MSNSPKFKDIMNITNTVDIYNTRKVLGGAYPEYVDNFLVYEEALNPLIKPLTRQEFESLDAQDDNVLYIVVNN